MKKGKDIEKTEPWRSLFILDALLTSGEMIHEEWESASLRRLQVDYRPIAPLYLRIEKEGTTRVIPWPMVKEATFEERVIEWSKY